MHELRETSVSPYENMDTTGPYRIKVLEKALAIIDLFDEPGLELTATEIAERLELNKTTAFRIASVLEVAGYLAKAPSTLRYRLGFKLFHLGSLVEGSAHIQRRARPYLEELKQQCDETVHLVVLHHGEALYLDKIEGKRAVRVVSRVGQTLPAHCSAVGKCLLAYLPDAEVDAIVRERVLERFTENTITDRAALHAELRRVRERGYATDEEEIELGLKCVAAPIRNAADEVVAAISLSGPKFRLDGEEMKRIVRLVLAAASRVSAAMCDDAAPTPEPRRRLRLARNGPGGE